MLKLLILSILFGFKVHAQDNNLKADRPDQSDGAAALGKNRFQIESAFIFSHVNDSGSSYISSSLLRYGVIKGLELRLLVEQGVKRDLYISETLQGFYPVAISVKGEIIKETNFPGVSLVGYLSIPFNNKSGKKYWAPAVFIILEKEVSDFTVTLNGGPKQEAFSNEWSIQFSGDLKYELNNKWAVFGEYFAQYDHHEPQHNIDGGLQFFIHPHLAVHLSGGSSIHHSPHNYFLNSGIAIEF